MTEKVSTPAFAALLGDLQLLAKSTDVTHEKIEQARSIEHKMQTGTELAKSEEAKKKEKEEEDKKEAEKKEREKNAGGKGEMCKSFTMKAEDGSTVEVVDSSELIKSLTDRLDTADQNTLAAFEGVTTLLKSLGSSLKSAVEKITSQDTVIQEQGTLIKSLKDDLGKVSSQGAGRRAVLTISEPSHASASTVMAKGGMPEGVTVDNFFAKAFDMQKAGKITGVDIAIAESALNSGMDVPANIVQRVLS